MILFKTHILKHHIPEHPIVGQRPASRRLAQPPATPPTSREASFLKRKGPQTPELPGIIIIISSSSTITINITITITITSNYYFHYGIGKMLAEESAVGCGSR